ncbi:hypothetical protein BCV69DRAFT_189044 [Microstroma glucosiphilum]|uniref:Uncharacterized protein n=1 Tax=Pseudomicrostroma glucosiphilum TaxID=1684307 RepID=A0A316U7F3_9BASI|nr:hypothetical protein BCV69DRAFT_189044 [Pseudomicrostroma glucosiphilum]PWN21167.1 hypothetical protein BCV69DRAFT_189044 [Pseudomicrostroma glucosiphilum]
MSLPRFKLRPSAHLSRFSLPFRPRHRRDESAPVDNDTAAGNEASPGPEAEGQPQPDTAEVKSKTPRTFFKLKLKKSCDHPECSPNCAPAPEEEQSPVPGSRAKKGKLPQLGQRMTVLFREPLVGQTRPRQDHYRDRVHHSYDGEQRQEKARHSTSERPSKSFPFFAGRRSYERDLLYRPATSLGVRLSTSSDMAPLIAQGQIPSRGPTPWPRASSELPEGRRSFNVKRKPVPSVDLQEATDLDEHQPPPKSRNEPEPEISISRASSVEFPTRPQVVRSETSNVTEPVAITMPAPAPAPMRRPRYDAMTLTSRLGPVLEEQASVEPADEADDGIEDELPESQRWPHRAEILAVASERDLDPDHTTWSHRENFVPPHFRPRVSLFQTSIPLSPGESGIISPASSGSNGGTPDLVGLGITLNTGSGTFGVGTGSPISPDSQMSPISPSDTESPGQQLLTPIDAANGERIHSKLAELCGEEGEGEGQGSAGSGSDEILCV